MLTAFQLHIDKDLLFTRADKLLVAVSGGVDSMVLCDLLLKAGYLFSVAHCNFKLRGNESDEDAEFVKNYCDAHELKFFQAEFDTTKYAESAKISVQMAARELRYSFFDKLISEHQYTYLLTAHHLNDNIETFFINLIRGSGINGLKGIETKKGNKVRPLLSFTKSEIQNYAAENAVSYRTDSSNEEEKYLRNFLRHHIIPPFKELNPSFEETMNKELQLLRSYNAIIANHFEQEKGQAVIQTENGLKIDLQYLQKSAAPELLLFEILKEYGFNPKLMANILDSAHGISGKLFQSEQYELVKDRDFLILNKNTHETEISASIKKEDTELSSPVHLKLKTVSSYTNEKNESIAYIDAQNLVYPLNLRHWKTGDKFKPIGMNGFKKLSDFFKDKKLNQFEKKKVWILENGNKEIIWVLDHRLDERYRVSEKTKTILRIELLGS